MEIEENKYPRKTKTASRWLVITGGIYLVGCIILLVYLSGVPRDSAFWVCPWEFLWDKGPAMGYLGFTFSLLGLDSTDLPLWIIVALPFILSFLCIFFGISLLSRRNWIKKKSGYMFVMIILSAYLLTTLSSIIGFALLYLENIVSDAPHLFEGVRRFFTWGAFIFFPVIFIILPPFILLYLDRKNFFKIVS